MLKNQISKIKNQNDADYIKCRLYRASSTKSGHSRRSRNKEKLKKSKKITNYKQYLNSNDLKKSYGSRLRRQQNIK